MLSLLLYMSRQNPLVATCNTISLIPVAALRNINTLGNQRTSTNMTLPLERSEEILSARR